MKNWLFIFLFAWLCYPGDSLMAQSDGVLWSSVRLRVPLEEGLTFSIKPTVRFNENISSYTDHSLDLVLSKRFSKHWTGAVLLRPWWLENGIDRFFIWPIVVYRQDFGQLKFKTRFFYHHAVNLDTNDADFLRLRPELSHAFSDRVSAAIAIEPFFLLNDFNEVTRTRYEFGATYKFQPNLSLNLHYWFEDQFGLWEERTDFNTLLTTLTYVLKPKKKPGE